MTGHPSAVAWRKTHLPSVVLLVFSPLCNLINNHVYIRKLNREVNEISDTVLLHYNMKISINAISEIARLKLATSSLDPIVYFITGHCQHSSLSFLIRRYRMLSLLIHPDKELDIIVKAWRKRSMENLNRVFDITAA